MKLLLNENFPVASVHFLRRLGYDAYSIGLDNPTISDRQVMEIAIATNRTILTFDRDYGELIFKYGYRPKAGVLYFRVEPIYAEYPGELAHKLIQSNELEFENRLTVIDEDKIRQKRY